jgi:hypothetical protein
VPRTTSGAGELAFKSILLTNRVVHRFFCFVIRCPRGVCNLSGVEGDGHQYNSLEIRDKSVRECPILYVLYSSIEVIQGRNTLGPIFLFDPLAPFTYFHVVFGSCTATHMLPHTAASSTTYVRYPPKMSFLTEKAKRDAAAAGATVLWIETTVCARPFVAPRDRLLGAAEHTYMNTEPYELQRSSVWVHRYRIGEHVLKPMSEIDIDPSCSMISTHNVHAPLPERSVKFSKGKMI